MCPVSKIQELDHFVLNFDKKYSYRVESYIYFFYIYMSDSSANWVREEEKHAKITRDFAPPCMYIIIYCVNAWCKLFARTMCIYDIIL